MNKPKAEKGMKCPLYKEDVSKVCHTCEMYEHIMGTNPNTGAAIDAWGCTFKFNFLTNLEIAKEVRQSAAATESFRNEFVKVNQFQALVSKELGFDRNVAGLTTTGKLTPPNFNQPSLPFDG